MRGFSSPFFYIVLMGYRVAGIVFGGLNQRKVAILSASGCLVSEIQRSILIFLILQSVF